MSGTKNVPGGITLSDRETKLMAMALLSTKGQMEVDYDKLATLGGYTNVRSAANAFNAIRKKINASLPAETLATAADNGDGPESKNRRKSVTASAESSQDNNLIAKGAAKGAAKGVTKRKAPKVKDEASKKRVKKLDFKSEEFVTEDDDLKADRDEQDAENGHLSVTPCPMPNGLPTGDLTVHSPGKMEQRSLKNVHLHAKVEDAEED